MKKVDIQDLASALVEAYEDYTEDVVEGIKDAADEISKDMLAEVRERAPKKTGKYAKGFRRMHKKLKSGAEYTIWNPKYYRLVHLLEKGWTGRSGKRVPGKPHMGPAEVKHTARFEKRAEQIIKEGGK